MGTKLAGCGRQQRSYGQGVSEGTCAASSPARETLAGACPLSRLPRLLRAGLASAAEGMQAGHRGVGEVLNGGERCFFLLLNCHS